MDLSKPNQLQNVRVSATHRSPKTGIARAAFLLPAGVVALGITAAITLSMVGAGAPVARPTSGSQGQPEFRGQQDLNAAAGAGSTILWPAYPSSFTSVAGAVGAAGEPDYRGLRDFKAAIQAGSPTGAAGEPDYRGVQDLRAAESGEP
jgi:hypothetical protein